MKSKQPLRPLTVKKFWLSVALVVVAVVLVAILALWGDTAPAAALLLASLVLVGLGIPLQYKKTLQKRLLLDKLVALYAVLSALLFAGYITLSSAPLAVLCYALSAFFFFLFCAQQAGKTKE